MTTRGPTKIQFRAAYYRRKPAVVQSHYRTPPTVRWALCPSVQSREPLPRAGKVPIPRFAYRNSGSKRTPARRCVGSVACPAVGRVTYCEYECRVQLSMPSDFDNRSMKDAANGPVGSF